MKNFRFGLLLLALLSIASLASAGPVPVLGVTVSNSAGKVVYRGKTNASGVFATANLEPGQYVVMFDSKSALQGRHIGLFISAGKQRMSADAVPGEKFSKGGVGMKLEVGRGLNMTGRVSDGAAIIPAMKKATPKPDKSVED